MAKDNKISKFISNQCYIQNITNKKVFKEKIDQAVYECDDFKDKYIRSESTIYRWLMGEITPEPYMYPFVAKALKVTEDELRAGKLLSTTKLQQEIDLLTELKNSNEKERNGALSILWPNKSFARYLATLLYIIAIYFLNFTLWKKLWIYVVSIIVFIIAMMFDQKNIHEENDLPFEKYSFKEDIQTLIQGLKLIVKLYKQKSLLAYTCIIGILFFIFLSLIPLVEFIAYRGSYYMTVASYGLIATLLLIKSFND